MMNKKNFNSIQNFSVPQNWIDNAVNIPKTAKKKPPVIFVNFSKTLVAVASLVLVCCISLVVFFMNNNNAVPSVLVIETKGTSGVFETDEHTQHNSENNSSTQGTSKTENIKDASSALTKPTSDTDTQMPTLPVEPTEKPIIEPSEGSSLPTESGDDLPLAPMPTDGMVEPSEGYWPVDPTNPEVPGIPPTENRDDEYVAIVVPKSKLTQNCKVYCLTYFNGELCSSSDLFSSQNETEITFISSSLLHVKYYPFKKGVIATQGVYYFYFYNENYELVAQESRIYR
ncbi:MAG: hypothetical protein IJ275_03710 [Ruminococcus sp.]|nr:hypothetical protein [Ruminococcus sp.]